MLRALSIAVVGAPYPNKDGSNRQFELMLCDVGDALDLRPEPKNPYDEHAIAVFSERDVQIGYVDSERAPYLKSLMRAGHTLYAILQMKTRWGAFIRVGVDHVPGLPQQKPAGRHPDPSADPDGGFYPDYIPPDE